MADHDLSARPARFITSDRTYQPPRPGYRRPGSDHSHIPESHERLTMQRDLADMTTEERDTAVLRALESAPLPRAALNSALGVDDWRGRKALDNTLTRLSSRGYIERHEDSDGSRWQKCGHRPDSEPTPGPQAADPEPKPAPQPAEAAPTDEPLDFDRLAVTSDGCLIIWEGGRQRLVDAERTRALMRMLTINDALIQKAS